MMMGVAVMAAAVIGSFGKVSSSVILGLTDVTGVNMNYVTGLTAMGWAEGTHATELNLTR
jgi:xanthine/uracil permease